MTTRKATIIEICNSQVRLCEEVIKGKYCFQLPTKRGTDRIDRCAEHVHRAPK